MTESGAERLFPVRLVSFAADGLWDLRGECRPLVDVENGGPPRLATTVSLFQDGERLFIVFDGADRETVSSLTVHDAPLYTEDVVEIFLAPFELTSYFEIEVNPRGTTFDASVSSPDLDRRTMHVDPSWNPPGLFAATRRIVRPELERSWQTLVSIPFADLGRSRPDKGERWRGNFYRIDRSPLGDELHRLVPDGQTASRFPCSHRIWHHRVRRMK